MYPYAFMPSERIESSRPCVCGRLALARITLRVGKKQEALPGDGSSGGGACFLLDGGADHCL
jgi:hypothetical protein